MLTVYSSPYEGRICDEHGDDIPPNTPPPPRPSNRGPDNWTPYANRVEFEVADFLYRRNQMSGGDIDFIFNLWAASLAAHGETPPFANHVEMYNVIDSTPLGDVAWQSFSSEYNGALPEGDIPTWMTSEYDVWFRDPRILVHNILSNPDFEGEFDYAPLQEYDTSNGAHRFQDFMSGDWCWKQAVSHFSSFFQFSHLSQFTGFDCRGSQYNWIYVRSNNPWQRQDYCLRRYWTQPVLASLYVDRQHPQQRATCTPQRCCIAGLPSHPDKYVFQFDVVCCWR